MTTDVQHTDQLQQALAERFALEGELGRGGMAVVYRARDLRNGRDVAIKVLRPELTATLGLERFLREIQIAGGLQHPHIVALHDSGQVAGILYYLMPYVEGESLRRRLQREQQLPIPEALRIAREVASALSYAHGRGVVHRDVKPENILLSSGHAMLTDFGVARAIMVAGGDTLTSSGTTVGTPAYMSPEQAGQERQLDGRTDVYSLGCVLYEMLAGHPPFLGTSAQEILTRHLVDPVPSLQVARPTVHEELQGIVEKALAKRPADRFRSAAALEEDLAAVEQGTPSRRHRRAVRRKRWLRATVAASIFLVLLGAWLLGARDERLLDSNKVVVFPLVGRGLSPSDSGAGYDVALMIGAALEHTDPLRWIDGWQRLNERQRASAGLVTARLVRAITRDRGARYSLEGTAFGTPDSVAVVLRLYDAQDDSLVAQETEMAAFGAPLHQLGLAAVRRLLPRLVDPGREIDLAPLGDREPAAIALWLQGEREYRRARFAPALEFYQRAVREDSALVFAAVKGAQAANWIHSSSAARQLLTAALARETLLPLRYRQFARGLDAYLAGQADSAVAAYERALAEDPQWEEALMALGDAFYHLLPSRAPLDSLARAAFEAALAADSAFSPAMLHLVEIATRQGELGRARALMKQLRDAQPDSTHERIAAFMLECAERGPSKVDWPAAARGNLLALLFAAKGLSAAAAQPECAEAGFRAILAVADAPVGQRWAALLGLQGLLAAQARTAELIALLDSAVESGTSQALWLYVIDAESGLPLHRQAAQMEAFARQRFGDGYPRAQPHVQWLLGTWHASLGHTQDVAALHSALTSGRQTRRTRLLADALDAQLAFARRDTAEAIAKLLALRPTATSDSLRWDAWESLAVEQLKLARLLLARGEYQEAHDVASVFDHHTPAPYVTFVPASLAIRLAAVRALGKSELAHRYRARLLRLGRGDLASAR